MAKYVLYKYLTEKKDVVKCNTRNFGNKIKIKLKGDTFVYNYCTYTAVMMSDDQLRYFQCHVRLMMISYQSSFIFFY